MPKYRRKPTVVEASLWFKNGDHPQDYAAHRDAVSDDGDVRYVDSEEQRRLDWEGQVVRRYRHPDVDGETPCQNCGVKMHHHGWIDTLEGGRTVCPGDYVITGERGDYYPCKQDAFESTHERVEE